MTMSLETLLHLQLEGQRGQLIAQLQEGEIKYHFQHEQHSYLLLAAGATPEEWAQAKFSVILDVDELRYVQLCFHSLTLSFPFCHALHMRSFQLQRNAV